ncbi:YqaE/Pmp3 family membrane protein [Neolewinella sp.]|uniref:YqaE/Pmp3 family membrane protein n=1 Tax=Neolewinella sp. TaxID=2993543 RepID=UPI003B525A0B
MSLRTFTLSLLLTLLAFGPMSAAIVVPVPPPTTEEATTANEAAALEAARAYRESLKSMSAKERRELKREQRRAMKEAIKSHRQDDIADNTLLLVLITILLPPLGMYLYQGEANSKFWISLVLWLLFYFPGLIYTLITILS